MTGLNKQSTSLELAPGFIISRVIKGGWQLSEGHSQPSAAEDPIRTMSAFAEKGITTFDCADIYTGVEELIGRFLAERRKRRGDAQDIKVLTKFVPDYDALATINKAYVDRIIDRSLKRLNVERLDMVQFSWWNYNVPRYVDAAYWLKELQTSGKIHLLSGTNFNTHAVRELTEAGIPLVTLQVQYSLLDARPEKQLVALCAASNIKLLCYGTVAGGFLSETWLGRAEPMPPFDNRSLVKYKLMIDEFGGWDLFQELLTVLKAISIRHKVSMSNVASRYVLDKPTVAGIIIGSRTAAHLDENLKVFDFGLTQKDVSEIHTVLAKASGPHGDVFDIERIKEGPHGSIMRYNLNG
jgi:aryl-alcohol dehydrogenase-like predicted oxidoreductase